MEGETYTPSYHTSWIGIVLSIVTLSIYHWLVVAAKMLKKRNTLVIGDDKIAWDGQIYGFTAFRDGYHREILKKLSTLVLEGKDIHDIVYLKNIGIIFGDTCSFGHIHTIFVGGMAKLARINTPSITT